MAGLNRPFRQPMVFGCPTVVNNVENSGGASLDHRTRRRGVWPWERKSKGTKLFSVSGHIRKPGVYELRWVIRS